MSDTIELDRFRFFFYLVSKQQILRFTVGFLGFL